MARTFAAPESGRKDTLTCTLEPGHLKAGDAGLDVRIFAKGVPSGDKMRGVRGDIQAKMELPTPVITSVAPPTIGTYGITNLTIAGSGPTSAFGGDDGSGAVLKRRGQDGRFGCRDLAGYLGKLSIAGFQFFVFLCLLGLHFFDSLFQSIVFYLDLLRDSIFRI